MKAHRLCGEILRPVRGDQVFWHFFLKKRSVEFFLFQSRSQTSCILVLIFGPGSVNLHNGSDYGSFSTPCRGERGKAVDSPDLRREKCEGKMDRPPTMQRADSTRRTPTMQRGATPTMQRPMSYPASSRAMPGGGARESAVLRSQILMDSSFTTALRCCHKIWRKYSNP